jgi:hypothetical protein
MFFSFACVNIYFFALGHMESPYYHAAGYVPAYGDFITGLSDLPASRIFSKCGQKLLKINLAFFTCACGS